MPDAVVVGAGICGASAAHFLAARGLDVLVLDRAGIAAGTTGRGEGNVLVCDKEPGPERDLALIGRELWGTLGERFPAARVIRKGALLLDDPDGSPAGALEPELAPDVLVTHDPGELMVDGPAMARALLDGIPVREGAEVQAADGGSVTLAGGERIAAGHVVLAPGPWAAQLTGLPVSPRKGQLVALAAPPQMIVHKLVEAAYIESVNSADAALQVTTVVEQTLDGNEILVGSSRERAGFDDHVSDAISRAMIERASRFVPRLAELEITRAWCGWRPWLPDNLPAIGRLPSGAWACTGHEGSGVCLGPVSGRLIAELIAGDPPTVDPAPFDPGRF